MVTHDRRGGLRVLLCEVHHWIALVRTLIPALKIPDLLYEVLDGSRIEAPELRRRICEVVVDRLEDGQTTTRSQYSVERPERRRLVVHINQHGSNGHDIYRRIWDRGEVFRTGLLKRHSIHDGEFGGQPSDPSFAVTAGLLSHEPLDVVPAAAGSAFRQHPDPDVPAMRVHRWVNPHRGHGV